MGRRLQTKGSRQTYFLSGNGKETLNIVGHGDWLVSVRYGGSPQRGDYTLPYYPVYHPTTIEQRLLHYFLPPYSLPAALLHSPQCIFATQQVTEPSKSATFSSVLRRVDSW